MNDDTTPITRKDLTDFGKQLASSIVAELRGEMQTMGTELRGEMQTMESRITENFRDELDAKLAATRTSIVSELKQHTEETVGMYNAELLENIANIIQPMQSRSDDHEQRIRTLERTVA